MLCSPRLGKAAKQLHRDLFDEVFNALASMKYRKDSLESQSQRVVTNLLRHFVFHTESLSQQQAEPTQKPLPEHVCGLQGYDGMRDPPCPACEARCK
jgi:hypothetical protein